MAQSPKPILQSLDHLVLTVCDVMHSLKFYQDVLGMGADSFDAADGTTRWALTFGRQKLNLHAAGREFEPKAKVPTPGSADLCFLTEVALEVWTAHLSYHGVHIEEGPVARTGATGPLRSIYLRDPDQNLIEISILAEN